MTTRLPTREGLTTLLEAVRGEPEGPDKATAIERLEAQLTELDNPAPDALVGPDADLFPPDVAPTSPARPASTTPPGGKPNRKPFP